MRLAWMFFLIASAAWAQTPQNTELWWMVGGINGGGAVVPSSINSGTTVVTGANTYVSGTVGFSTEIGYAYQMKSTQAGNFWVEVPMTFTWQGSGYISGSTVLGSNRNFWFFTPGIRFKTPTFGRVSFFGSAGGGFAALIEGSATNAGYQGTSSAGVSLKVHPAADFSGGIDVRLSRLLSLRVQARDYVTGRNLGLVAGHNHPVYLIGLAFHF